jgi:hypothetical protein
LLLRIIARQRKRSVTVLNPPRLPASRPAHSGFSSSRERQTIARVFALRHDAFERFQNVVMSRSMNHKGVEFLILARPGREQWTVVISYPRSTNPTKVPFEGSRDKAIAVACARIDGWLNRQQTDT